MYKPIEFTLLIFLLALVTVSCTNNKAPLFKKDESSEAEKNNTLFVFVGEKIEVKELPQDEGSWDGKYLGKYKILQRVYGNCILDTIEFIAYDHYGEPAFSRYKNVLLFVSELKGTYYHEKYQFYDVYKTKDKRWAGRYSVRDLGYDNKRNKNVSAQKIDFAEEASFPFALLENKKEIPCWFPEPYYKIENDKAIACYGNYIKELFRIKKEGALTARGLFGNGKPEIELDVPDVKMEEISPGTEAAELLTMSKAKWNKFISFWGHIIKSRDSFDFKALVASSLDSVYINDTLSSSNNSKVRNIFSKDILQAFQDSTQFWRPSYEVSKQLKESKFFKKMGLPEMNNYPFFEAETIIDTVNTFEKKMSALFLITKTGFKFYRVKEERSCICWQ